MPYLLAPKRHSVGYHVVQEQEKKIVKTVIGVFRIALRASQGCVERKVCVRLTDLGDVRSHARGSGRRIAILVVYSSTTQIISDVMMDVFRSGYHWLGDNYTCYPSHV